MAGTPSQPRLLGLPAAHGVGRHTAGATGERGADLVLPVLRSAGLTLVILRKEVGKERCLRMERCEAFARGETVLLI